MVHFERACIFLINYYIFLVSFFYIYELILQYYLQILQRQPSDGFVFSVLTLSPIHDLNILRQ